MYSSSDLRAARTVYLLLAGAVGAWLLWDSVAYRLVTYSLWADYWEHSAALTEWMRDLVSPGNPHLADGSSTSRYIPSFLALAALGRLLDLNAIDLMSIHAVINYGLLALGIWLFSSSYFGNRWAPSVVFVVLLSAWGVPWIWANIYELRSLFSVASYPSTLVLGLSLISFWLAMCFLRGHVGLIGGFFGLFALSALMFVSHALTGVFAIGSCCVLALVEKNSPLSLRTMILIAMLAGAFAAEFWPWFSVWDVVLAKSDAVDDRTWQSFQGIGGMLDRVRSGAWMHMFYRPEMVLVALGPALIGVPICLWLLLRWDELFIPLGALMMSVPFVANVFFQIALAHRFLLFVVFFLHLAIAWAILTLLDNWNAAKRTHSDSALQRVGVSLSVLGLAALSVFHVVLLAGDYRGQHLKQSLEVVDKRRHLPEGASVVDVYTELVRPLAETSVVIGNAKLTWPLPTFRGKVVSLPENHENSLVPDEFERVAAEQAFLDPATRTEDRQAILERYQVTHVLVNVDNTAPALLDWLATRSVQVAAVGQYRMLALDPKT